MLFSKKHPDAHGVLRYRESQRKLVFLSAVIFAVLCILTVAFAASPDTQQRFRSCSLCHFVNCVEPTFITVSISNVVTSSPFGCLPLHFVSESPAAGTATLINEP